MSQLTGLETDPSNIKVMGSDRTLEWFPNPKDIEIVDYFVHLDSLIR